MLLDTLQWSHLANHSLEHLPIVTDHPCHLCHLCLHRPGPSYNPHCTGPRAEDRATSNQYGGSWRPQRPLEPVPVDRWAGLAVAATTANTRASQTILSAHNITYHTPRPGLT